MKKFKAEGDHLILEKINYDEEQTTAGGIIYKPKDVLDSSFLKEWLFNGLSYDLKK